ncbi:MAG: GIY-YIG nuclease family protein [Erysipelotrichaceae bacterium]|nr:GIY-YIG nuclease family protein [Erysipelotrichaceae bacterium]
MKYYVYIIRCFDNSLYTGITTDVQRRYKQHLNGVGAKYTQSHKPISLEAYCSCSNRSQASKMEYFLKKLSKQQKENIIKKIIVIWKNIFMIKFHYVNISENYKQ